MKKEKNTNFGYNLKKLREENNISQSKLGEILGVSSNAVYTWEKLGMEPDYNTLKKISKLFGVSTDFLLDCDKDFDINNSIDFKNKTIKKVIEMLKDKNITEKDLEQAVKIIDVLKENKKK